MTRAERMVAMVLATAAVIVSLGAGLVYVPAGVIVFGLALAGLAVLFGTEAE